MKYILLFFLFLSGNCFAYGPYNQAFTMNQQYGSTNWYSSPLGMGVAQAGVTLIGGLVNMMNRPDPVQYIQPQQQPIYINQQGGAPTQQCPIQLVPSPGGAYQYVKVCPQ